MNLKHYLAASAAMLALAACSSDEPAVDTNLSNETAGYLAVGVNLPTTQGSRAFSYDQEGTSSEYAVTSATLLVWQGNTSGNEMTYTFVEADNLNGLSGWNASSEADVTTTSKGVAKLSGNIKVNGSETYYAFVMLNNDGQIALPSAGQTYGEWIEKANTVTLDPSKPLYMASAPKYNNDGKMPVTLVSINKGAIASTEATATEVGANIYVERGVAKVSVAPSSFEQKSVTSEAYVGGKVTIKAWALDITNKTTFGARNVQNLTYSYADIWTNSRFTGGAGSFTRALWSKDPNYDPDITTQQQVYDYFNTVSASALSYTASDVAYCLENTFDIYHQKQGQTTRVVLKASFTPAGFTEGQTFMRVGVSSTIYTPDQLHDYLRSQVAKTFGVDESVVYVNLGDFPEKGGSRKMETWMFYINSVELTADQLKQLSDNLGYDYLQTYLNGECYYVARIKHFGDDLTPWKLGDTTYGGDNAAFLGRYGVVRNTWYELSVGSVASPGSPDVPPINPDDPDDESDLYITLRVNVLNWAKVAYSVDL